MQEADLTEFVTHVELRDASASDYEALDRTMIMAGFAPVRRTPAGIEHKLPKATYLSYSVGRTAEDVRNAALAVVLPLKRDYDIISVAGDISFSLHPA